MYNYWLLLASSSQLLVIQFVTTNNLIAGRAQSLKKAWSFLKAWYGRIVSRRGLISCGRGSCAEKVGAYAEGLQFSAFHSMLCSVCHSVSIAIKIHNFFTSLVTDHFASTAPQMTFTKP